MDFQGAGAPLTQGDMDAAAAALGLQGPSSMSALWAVLTVESRGFGFLDDRRPKLLFERHVFFRETGGRFAAVAPQLCAASAGGYAGGKAEYQRLAQALQLCRDAGLDTELALRSASWGLGQVMGFNAVVAGFASAAEMVRKMAASEGAQLGGMAGFMRSQKLDVRLRALDWAGFARGYNGSSFSKNQYDIKLAAAFAKFESGIGRDLRVRAAQAALLFLGYAPGDPDGVEGQNTRRELRRFRSDHGHAGEDALDDAVFEDLMRRAGWR